MRAIRLLFGVASYAFFFVTFLYLVAFVADLPLAPRTVSHGPAASTGVALVVDLALVALFGIQHSVMARPRFKAWWTRTVHPAIERSVYVFVASALLVLLFWAWRPVFADWNLWFTDDAAFAPVLLALGFAGWGVVLISTFLINHFELFGLQQVWSHPGGHDVPVDAPRLRTPFLYKWVRHPLYLGFLIAFWVTPQMTASRALFAVAMTIYILIGVAHEERDLTETFGEDYLGYRKRVGKLLPGIGRG